MKRKYYYFLAAAIIIGGCFLAKSQWDKQNTESTERIRFETTKEEDKTVRFIKDNIARTTDFWLYVLSDSCPKYREPNLIIYKGEIECQKSAKGETHTGIFYSPADSTIYFDMAYLEFLHKQSGIRQDFITTYLVAHCVSHHVQNILGISSYINELGTRMDEERKALLEERFELQADCMAEMFMNRDNLYGDVDESIKLDNMRTLRHTSRKWEEIKPEKCIFEDSHTITQPEMVLFWMKKADENPTLQNTNTFHSVNIDIKSVFCRN